MNRPPRRARRPEPTVEEFAAGAGMPVEDLIREVAEFRVALEADMTIAAAAAELGEAEIASAMVGAERQHLADFESRALRALAPRSVAPVIGQRHVRRTRLAFAAAIALITALGGALSYTDRGTPAPATSNLALVAAERYAVFSNLASGDVSASQMIAAAARLHSTLADLVRQDPASVDQVASILRSEQQQLLRWLPAGTTVVLADAKALVAQMRAGAPAKAAAVLSQVRIDSPPPQSQEGSHPKPAKPTPTPTSSPKPQPTPTPTSSPKPQPAPTPTQQPSSSPSPTPPVIPGAPHNPIP